jgi:hypothetical protein
VRVGGDEKRGRAMPLVVVSHRSGATLL